MAYLLNPVANQNVELMSKLFVDNLEIDIHVIFLLSNSGMNIRKSVSTKTGRSVYLDQIGTK